MFYSRHRISYCQESPYCSENSDRQVIEKSSSTVPPRAVPPCISWDRHRTFTRCGLAERIRWAACDRPISIVASVRIMDTNAYPRNSSATYPAIEQHYFGHNQASQVSSHSIGYSHFARETT
jgi:hypothetical protein